MCSTPHKRGIAKTQSMSCDRNCWYTAGTLVHCWYTASSLLVHYCYTAGTLLVYCWCTASILLVHCQFAAGTLLLLCWYTLLVYCWYTAGTQLVHYQFAAGTLLVHCWCTASTLLVQCWYTAGTLLVYCWYSAGTVLVHSWYIGYIADMGVGTRPHSNSPTQLSSQDCNSLAQLRLTSGRAYFKSRYLQSGSCREIWKHSLLVTCWEGRRRALKQPTSLFALNDIISRLHVYPQNKKHQSKYVDMPDR